MFPDNLLNSPLFGIGLTVILYAFSEILVDRLGLRVLPPFVPACVGIIALTSFTVCHSFYLSISTPPNF